MNLLKKFFGGNTEISEKDKLREKVRNFDMLKYEGVRALKKGQSAYALECFEKALEIDPELELRDYYSQALIMNNKLGPALEQLDEMSKAQPDNILIYMRMANVAYMLEDYDAMTHACIEALRIDDNNSEANYIYARACIGKNELINALALLTKAITANEKYDSAYLLRSETLLKMGDLNSAENDAKWLAENAESSEDILLLRARIAKAKGESDIALEFYAKVIEQNPFCIDAFKERGALKLSLGDKEGAEEDMRQVLELNPKEQNGINGEFTAEGTENIQQKVEQAYRSVDPYGIGGIGL